MSDSIEPDLWEKWKKGLLVEEQQVVALCERFGYGRVMQIASETWAEKDPVGSFIVGTCRGLLPCKECGQSLSTDRRRSPEERHIAQVNDMDVVPEDVRGADVGEAREKWAGELDEFIAYVDGCEGLTLHQRAAICNTVSFMLSRLVPAALRSPEPAAEPRYTLADAMDVLGRAIMDLANEAEILRTQHVDNLRALDSGRRIQKIVDALARLRSGGATTETGGEK